jgi:hypothetical protein
MKITAQTLMAKLEQLDKRLVDIWLEDNLELHDDEIWELFVLLLESRVELLKSCKDAGLQLSQEQCLPGWLQRLVDSRGEMRVRELKLVQSEMKQKTIKSYKTTARADKEADL